MFLESLQDEVIVIVKLHLRNIKANMKTTDNSMQNGVNRVGHIRSLGDKSDLLLALPVLNTGSCRVMRGKGAL